MLELEVKKGRFGNRSVIELAKNGKVVATIYPEGESAIKIATDYRRIEVNDGKEFVPNVPVIIIEPKVENDK